jgi:hypothetical protein
MSLGTSRRFPNNGNLFGPGGNGSLVLVRRQFQMKARTATAHSGVKSRALLLLMLRDELTVCRAGGDSVLSVNVVG